MEDGGGGAQKPKRRGETATPSPDQKREGRERNELEDTEISRLARWASLNAINDCHFLKRMLRFSYCSLTDITGRNKVILIP